MSKQILKVAEDTIDTLTRYSWPGNIRELQNFIERAVILSKSDVLEMPSVPSSVPFRGGPVTLKEAELEHVVKALEESNWVVGGKYGAAARLGIARTTLIHKMRTLGLSRQLGPRSEPSTAPKPLAQIKNGRHVSALTKLFSDEIPSSTPIAEMINHV
jgi:formate hydrogenlyase transcriptional activator